ncbi:hypothetical protein VTN77DRAFT_9472 [Rasamsonia byssochlamydoides]|uniref:uncharacterized protein n=1 Tax=Rasamsonia byssochlamydoides TaxID=89139 RepID=UPI003743CD9C
MVSLCSKRLFLLLILSSVQYVAAVSLSQFQQIAGFSASCMAVWTETIPGCTTRDFSKSHTCSAICIAGLSAINEEVIQVCAGARVSSDTLLGQFLQGSGVLLLCPNVGTDSTTTETTSTESTSQIQSSTELVSTSSQPSETVETSSTAETTTSTTSTTQATSQAQASPQPTVAATLISVTSTSRSDTSPTSSPSTLEISIGGTTGTVTTNAEQHRGSRTSSAASTSTDIEAKGFGGVGDAFNILGNDATRSKRLSQQISAGLVAAVLIAGTMW